MIIEARTIVGAAAAFTLVGAVMWAGTAMLTAPTHTGRVEVTQVAERSWAVEVKDLGSGESTETAVE